MDANSLMFFFAGIAISAAIFALLILFYPKLTERATGTAGEKQASHQALLTYLYYGMLSADRTGERALREGFPIPPGRDKRKIAGSVYEVLPPKVDGEDIAAIKHQVSQEQFEQMLQDAFSGFDRFFKENQSHFDRQYETWKKEHPPL